MQFKREQFHALKHYWLSVAFFAGFLIDNITLNRVDQLFDNFVLASYVLLAGTGLALLYAAAADKVREDLRPYLIKYTPLFVQFSFGGLMSGILIFYGRSGSWFASWPFLVIILGIIVSNEVIKRRAQRLILNFNVLFIGLFSYVTLVLPIILGRMGAWIFVGGGLISLLAIYVYGRILYRIVPKFMTVNMRVLIFSVGMTFATLNFLYFTNIIPPIPLSLKDIGVYHNIEHPSDDVYRLTYEDGRWFEPFKHSDDTFHYLAGDKVYCYAAVFAPTRIAVKIFHRWEYKDSEGEWVTRSRLSYDIQGGRDGGFRGFTYQDEVHAGKWRCTVETARGQVLGREVFKISVGEEPRELISRDD